MSEYTMACTVGAPGQTSAIVIVSRDRKFGPIDPVSRAPQVTRTLNVMQCERLPAGLKDSEIADQLNNWLGTYPYAGHTRVFIEHPGGKMPIARMNERLRSRPGIWVQGVRVAPDSDGVAYTADGLKRVTQHEIVSYLVPICADGELQNPFPELSQQLLTADPNTDWRDGDSDLASALFLAAWFSRYPTPGPRSGWLV